MNSDIRISSLDLLDDAISNSRWDRAESLLKNFLLAHAAVHDGFRNWVAGILSRVLEEYGQIVVEKLHEAHGTWAELEPTMSLPPRELVQRIADVNHWHMSRFLITEDEKKITFHLQPCGSGGRLINEGKYYATIGRPYALVPQASPSTFAMTRFPVYCNHCSEMSRTILKGGGHGWLIEGWSQDHRFGGCRLHVYKTYSCVDDEFFVRLGLEKRDTSDPVPARAIFSPGELDELSQSQSDCLRRSIEQRDGKAARQVIARARVAWTAALLPAYKKWVMNLFRSIDDMYGAGAVSTLVRQTAGDLVSAIGGEALRTQPKTAWSDYWREAGALQAAKYGPEGTSFELSLAAMFSSEEQTLPLLLRCTDELCLAINEALAANHVAWRLAVEDGVIGRVRLFSLRE
jgi:hypothetical protein